MKKRFCKQIITFILTTTTIFSLSGCKKDEPLDELQAIQKQLLEMEGYYCTASLTRSSNKSEKVYETVQNVKVSGEYKLELTAPSDVAGNYTLFDGEQICQYNPRLDTKVVRDIEFDKSRNELFLNQFMANYLSSEGVDVAVSSIDNSKYIVLEAIIGGTDESLSYEKLWIDPNTYLPVRLSLYDKNDEERYRLEYDNFVYNPDFPKDIFVID